MLGRPWWAAPISSQTATAAPAPTATFRLATPRLANTAQGRNENAIRIAETAAIVGGAIVWADEHGVGSPGTCRPDNCCLWQRTDV